MRNAVVIIGGGMMGSGIAAVSALSFNRTIIVDITSAQAQAGIERAVSCMNELAAHELVSEKEVEEAAKLLESASHMEKALEAASLVIEAVTENLSLKQELFRKLDELLPAEIPILSNTSGLRITEIAEQMKRPERAFTAHFW